MAVKDAPTKPAPTKAGAAPTPLAKPAPRQGPGAWAGPGHNGRRAPAGDGQGTPPMAIAAVSCGVLGLLLSFGGLAFGPLGGFAVAGAVAAIVCGILALRDPRTAGTGRVIAIIGLVLGIVQVGLMLVALLVMLVLIIACGAACRDNNSSSESSSSGCGCGDACSSCGEGCASCGDGCSSCGKGCNEGCSGCGEGCSACGDGCSSCGGGSGGGGACVAPECQQVALGIAGVGLVAVPAARPSVWVRAKAWVHHQWHHVRANLAHHPAGAAYRADVFHVRGVRLCVGCFTLYPVFLGAVVVLELMGGVAAWPLQLAAGLAFAAVQGISALGWTRWRPLKVAVKSSLGIGLALAVTAIAHADIAPLWRFGALMAILGLAMLSTVPRARRLARVQAAS